MSYTFHFERCHITSSYHFLSKIFFLWPKRIYRLDGAEIGYIKHIGLLGIALPIMLDSHNNNYTQVQYTTIQNTTKIRTNPTQNNNSCNKSRQFSSMNESKINSFYCGIQNTRSLTERGWIPFSHNTFLCPIRYKKNTLEKYMHKINYSQK